LNSRIKLDLLFFSVAGTGPRRCAHPLWQRGIRSASHVNLIPILILYTASQFY
jgi:hypothetical protein